MQTDRFGMSRTLSLLKFSCFLPDSLARRGFQTDWSHLAVLYLLCCCIKWAGAWSCIVTVLELCNGLHVTQTATVWRLAQETRAWVFKVWTFVLVAAIRLLSTAFPACLSLLVRILESTLVNIDQSCSGIGISKFSFCFLYFVHKGFIWFQW